jgi:hypothetical protein
MPTLTFCIIHLSGLHHDFVPAQRQLFSFAGISQLQATCELQMLRSLDTVNDSTAASGECMCARVAQRSQASAYFPHYPNFLCFGVVSRLQTHLSQLSQEGDRGFVPRRSYVGFLQASLIRSSEYLQTHALRSRLPVERTSRGTVKVPSTSKRTSVRDILQRYHIKQQTKLQENNITALLQVLRDSKRTLQLLLRQLPLTERLQRLSPRTSA